MKSPLSRFLTLVAGGTVLCVAVSARADPVPYDVDLTAWGYGNVSQLAPGINPGGACGPTSVVNSFVYLDNRYGVGLIPQIVGNTPMQNQIAVVNTLSGLMQNVGNGVTDQNFLNGKLQYLNNAQLLGTITVEAQGNNLNTVHGAFVNVDQMTPTWSFLYDQLLKGQDVEVGFSWNGTGGPSEEHASGHWVTAKSFHFLDLDGDGVIDANENAWMDFVDPWGGVSLGDPANGTITMDGTNHMVLTYNQGAAGLGASGTIDIIVAESVPEPTSLALLGLGVLALCLHRRRA